MKPSFFVRSVFSSALAFALLGAGCTEPSPDAGSPPARPSPQKTERGEVRAEAKSAPQPEREATIKAPVIPTLREAAFLVFLEGGARVVLQKNPDASLRVGRAHLVSFQDETVVRHDVNISALSPEFAQLRGKRMILWDRDDIVCEGVVRGFSILNRVQPTDETLETWGGTYLKKPWKAVDIAMHAFSLSEQQEELLTADLLIDRGNCAGALWASSAATTPPRIARFQPADEGLRRAVLAELRSLPAYQAVFGESAPWEQHTGLEPKISVIRAIEDESLLVSFAFENNMTYPPRFPGYGGATGNFWALWEVKGWPERPQLILRNNPAMPWNHLPTMAVDRDGDGAWEMISDRGFLHLEAGLYQKFEQIGPSRVQPYPYPEEDGGC